MKALVFSLRTFLFLSILFSLGGGAHLVRADLSPLSAGGPDKFGYTWNDTLPFAWIDNTGGSNAGFNGVDDGFVGPIPIGFSFKFYENTYTQLYISTNGLLTFGQGSTIFANQPIPRTTRPDNFLAPFWDDLAVGGSYNAGKVYYGQGISGNKGYFAVEWNGVTRAGNTVDTLTFEAILYDDGGICYQYKNVNGILDNATIGIEDGDGVDGLQYLFNSPGVKALENSHALCFLRPAPAPRAKILPIYQSKFIQQNVAEFSVLVRNTGENGTDTFDILTSITGSQWPVSFFHADGLTPLADTDHDGVVDTGTVAQGNSITIIVRSQASNSALVGDYSMVTLTARSALDASKTATAVLQSAIPAPFVQVYDTNQAGMYLHVIQPETQSHFGAVPDFTGSTMTLAAVYHGNYIFVWERNGFNGVVNYSDIEYLMMNSFGQVTHDLHKLTSNGGATQYVADHTPALAVLPDGKIGITWVRNMINSIGELNSNVYLAILDPTGGVLQTPINVTNNSNWRSAGNPGVPYFNSPRLAAAGGNAFIITWADDRTQNIGETSDIYFAIYGSDSSLKKAPTALTQSNLDGTRYLLPVLVGLENGRILLAYSVEALANPANILTYTVLDSSGSLVKAPTQVAGSNAWNVDGIQLDTGKIVLSWTDLGDNHIRFAVLSGDTYMLQIGPIPLDTPYYRLADYVSVTADHQGHAILTWMDAEQNNYLFYALIDGNGTVVTPPMIFDTGLGPGPFVLTSSVVGGGNAPYQPGEVNLPFLVRR